MPKCHNFTYIFPIIFNPSILTTGKKKNVKKSTEHRKVKSIILWHNFQKTRIKLNSFTIKWASIFISQHFKFSLPLYHIRVDRNSLHPAVADHKHHFTHPTQFQM